MSIIVDHLRQSSLPENLSQPSESHHPLLLGMCSNRHADTTPLATAQRRQTLLSPQTILHANQFLSIRVGFPTTVTASFLPTTTATAFATLAENPKIRAPRHLLSPAQSVDEPPARSLRRDDIDDDVQEPLHREHQSRDVVEREIDAGRVREGVDAVDRRRDPDDEHRQKEQERDARVEPGARVGGFLHRFLACHVADA